MSDMIRVLPYMSGFRSSESLELIFTDYYDELYSHRKGGSEGGEEENLNTAMVSSIRGQSDFEVALPIRDIRSCRLFDTGLYLKYQRERGRAQHGFLGAGIED